MALEVPVAFVGILIECLEIWGRMAVRGCKRTVEGGR